MGDRNYEHHATIKVTNSADKFDMLFEYSPFGIAMINHETGKFVEVNKALLAMTGYTKEEFLNLSFWDITPPEYEEQEIQQKKDIELKGGFGPNEKEYIRKDGSRFPIRLRGFLLEDVDGTKLVWGLIEDISNQFRRIFDDLQDAYIQTDLALDLILMNNKTIKLFGYMTIDELIGKNLKDLVFETEELSRVRALLASNARLQDFNLKCLRSDGSWFWGSLNIQIVKDESGKAKSIECVVRDISDRKKLEESLKKIEELFRGIVNSMDDVVYTLDTDMRHTGVYGNWINKSNLSKDSFLGKTASELFGPEYGLLHEEPTRRALSGESVVYEWNLHDANSTQYFQTSLSPMYTVEGAVFGVVGIGRDITSIKQKELELNNSLMQKKRILDNLQDAYFQSDPQGFFTFVNPCAVKMFGYQSTDELLGHQGSILWADPQDRMNMIEQLRDKGHLSDYVCQGIRKDGTPLWVSLNIQFIKDERNEIIGTENVVRDITVRKRMENEILAMNRELNDQKELFRTLVENIEETIGITDADRIIRYRSSNNEKTFGRAAKDVVGKHAIDYVHHDDRERLNIEFSRVVNEGPGALMSGEFKYYRSDGSTVILELVGKNMLDNGLIGGVIFTYRDITEKKEREKERIAESEKIRALIESTDDFIWVVDATDFGLLIFNTALATFFDSVLGVKIQQGMPPEGMLPKPLVPAWLSMYNEALVKGPYRFIYEMKTIGKTLELSFNLLRVDGNTIGISVLSRDISEIFTQRDKLREANESLSRALGQTIDAISKIAELRDAYTAGHQKRVKTLACEIARVLGLPDEDIKNISFGALIHDIGKVYIPSEILTKPGKITQLEFKIIQTHAERGYHVVKNMDIDSRIPTMVYQHHERLDGSGYPQGLTGEEIILESRILAVADVVEAMISHRPYRAALGVETALEEITHHRGKKYDPIVVDACLKLFREKNFEFEN